MIQLISFILLKLLEQPAIFARIFILRNDMAKISCTGDSEIN